MKKRTKRHPVKNSYQCATCGKCFISWNNIQMHMTVMLGTIHIYMCSVWRGIHLQEPHQETHKDSYCGKYLTLLYVWQGPNPLEQLEE